MPRKAKKNAQGAGTIRKRSDGRWEARYTVGFDPVTGKQKQKSIYGKTQREVREQLAEITTELDNGTYIEPSKTRLENGWTPGLEPMHSFPSSPIHWTPTSAFATITSHQLWEPSACRN